MNNTAHDITERLLNALDKNYNVVDMGAISEIISVLENMYITKELLETTRLGKHINELRRHTTDTALARRAKTLVKKWRDLVIPDKAGGKSQSSSNQYQQQIPPASMDSISQQSHYGSRGYSPSVTPNLISPPVPSHSVNFSHKYGSMPPSASGSIKSSSGQHIEHHHKRQPLTSPAHRNVPQVGKNPTAPYSSGMKTLASPLVSPVVGGHSRNTSIPLKNLSPGLQHKLSPGPHRIISPGVGSSRNMSKLNTAVPFTPGLKTSASPLVSPVVSSHSRNSSPALKNLSPGVPQKFSTSGYSNKNFMPRVNTNVNSPSASRNSSPSGNSSKGYSGANKHSPSGVIGRNSSPAGTSLNKISPHVSHRNTPVLEKNTSVGQINRISTAVKNLSPALRLSDPAIKTSSSKKSEHYDSDSQDVIWVDDDEDVHKPVPANPLTVNDRSSEGLKSARKRSRSPVNGEQWREGRRESKKSKKETRGRKAKKRRNHESENRTVDHSLDPVPSPFLPTLSSSSTSPILKNGIISTGMPVPTPASSVPVIIEDIDSRSLEREPAITKQRTSRKNGCKKNSLDDYSTFIKNKIPAAGKKVKTTIELLEEIQSRKSSVVVGAEEKSSKIKKEDFLTSYDNKKKELITDIIELNDSNSSLQEDISSSKCLDVKSETKENEPVKFEPVETILARLPPIDRSWIYKEDSNSMPACTCTLIYTTPEVEVKMPSPLAHQPRKSIFEMDYDDVPKDSNTKDQSINSVVVPALPLYEEKIDPNCKAALYQKSKMSKVVDSQVLALHNCYIPDVNGTTCDKSLQFGSKKRPLCKMDYWGCKPYYDCASELFHSVVPKYNYLDYSLDRCVKNLTKVDFDRYEPVQATSDTKQWLNDMERITSTEAASAIAETEKFNSSADSPFSESVGVKEEGSDLLGKVEGISDRVNMDSVNLDRDLAISNSVAFDDNSSSLHSTLMQASKVFPSFDDKEFQMDCDDVDSVGSESCKPWTENSPSENVDQSQIEYSIHGQNSNVKNETKVVKKQLEYGDSVMSLPLNLKALNAAVGYGSKSPPSYDLSCVFRTNFNTYSSDKLTYSNITDPVILNSFDDLRRGGVVENLRRKGSIDQMPEIDQDEDAVSDIDIKPRIADNTNGALYPELDVCVSNGCPEWLDKLSRDESFREWHEPVVRTSLNDEPLTVLPYIVID